MSTWSSLVAVLLVSLPLLAGAQAVPYQTPDERAVYAMGILQAKQLRNLLFTDSDFETFLQGMNDEVKGQHKLDFDAELGNVQQFRQARFKAAIEAEKQASRDFATRAAAESGAETTESGLIFTSLRDGTGEKPNIVDKVIVHYHGTLRDGTVFDSSREREKPAEFALNRVIPCWTEGLQKMRVGGKAKFVCPPEIAYGDRGAGQLIRPGAILIFETELLSIQK
jgi:FKBP-type peptidyl-prolyl cis-trans isomerase